MPTRMVEAFGRAHWGFRVVTWKAGRTILLLLTWLRHALLAEAALFCAKTQLYTVRLPSPTRLAEAALFCVKTQLCTVRLPPPTRLAETAPCAEMRVIPTHRGALSDQSEPPSDWSEWVRDGFHHAENVVFRCVFVKTSRNCCQRLVLHRRTGPSGCDDRNACNSYVSGTVSHRYPVWPLYY